MTRGDEPSPELAATVAVTPRDTPTRATASPLDATIPSPRDAAVTLSIGARLGGRYLVEAFLGEGGMGAVYRAIDEKLGEPVALKVVRGSVADATLREEVRLAQKVTHPNVCRTYDLEEADGYHFIKMEYVAGETLATRIGRGKITIDEALRIARAIAEGLVAAHASGIVHRDLKPGNVMLVDPRVVLTDFGVARLISAPTDGIAGTLGYMAPEQITNAEVDGRADLYALGCLLYEMLTGEWVFVGTPIALATLHVSKPPPDVRAKRPDTPRWLARVVARLLAKQPGERRLGFAQLATDRALARRRLWIAGGMVAAIAGSIVASVALSSPGTPQCKNAERRLAGAWDATTKASIKAAFDATRLPFAPRAFTAVERALDRYATTWTTTWVESCEATRVHGDQSVDVLALREDCLDQRLDELRAFTNQLAHADRTVVAKASDAALELESIDRCSNVPALRNLKEPPAGLRQQVKLLRARLAEAKAGMLTGKFGTAINGATEAADGAKLIRFDALEAEARYFLGASMFHGGNPPDAEATLATATWLGLRSRRDDIAAAAAMLHASITSGDASRTNEARLWLDLGTAAAARTAGLAGAGLGDRRLELLRLEVEGVIAGNSHEAAAGIAAHEKAIAAAIELYGAESTFVAQDELLLAGSLAKHGEFVRALPHYERALALMRANRVAQHVDDDIAGLESSDVDIAAILTGLGTCYVYAGAPDKARAVLGESLAIYERAYGADSPALLPALNNTAEAFRDAGDAAAGLPIIERAGKLADKAWSHADSNYHNVVTTHAELLLVAGHTDEARAMFDTVIGLEDKTHSDYLGYTLTARAKLALGEQRWAEAAALDARAVAFYDALGAPGAVDVWKPLVGLARAQLGLGRPADARPLLERALAIGEQAGLAPSHLASIRELLAEARARAAAPKSGIHGGR